MSLLLDKSLGLIYKNMVGLSNINVDNSGNTFFINSLTVNSNLYCSGNTLLIGSTSLNSNLYNNNNFINNGIPSFNSSLNISGSSIISGNITIANSLNINGSTNINNTLNTLNNVTYQSILNTNNLISNNGINTDIINSLSPTLNIMANTINIGNSNSIVNINGTSTFIASTESLIMDKLLTLNVNSTTFQGADIGIYSGIEILGISARGYLRTSLEASRFELKTPLFNSPKTYITVQDINNNLEISGTTNLIGSTTINSNLYVKKLSIFNNTTINNSLNISSNSILNGSTTINSSLNVNDITIINNNCSINSILNVNGTCVYNNPVSINSFLNINGNNNINGIITTNNILNLNNNLINNNSVSINSSLNVSGLTIINGSLSINNSLNITGTANINGNININSNLNISNNSNFINSCTLNSSLNVSGVCIFNSISINSNLGMYGQFITKLPNYNLNADAKNAGVPIWGWYRTGGVLKVRLNDVPPTVYLSGASSINIITGRTFTDPGAYGYDFYNNLLPIYLNVNNSSTTLISNVLISGTSSLVTGVSTLSVGNYTATYTATDSDGLIGLNYRMLTITTAPPIPSGIFFWIDANDSSTITKDTSNNIISITDKSSNNINMIPYYGNTQILSNGINNMPNIKIDDSGFISSNLYQNSNNYTFAIVVTIYQNNLTGLILGHYPIQGSVPGYGWDRTLVFRMVYYTTNIEVQYGSQNLQTLNAIPVLFIATRTNNLLTLKMINLLNNNITSITPGSPISNNPFTIGNYNLFIGRLWNTNDNNFNGRFDIGEIMYWLRELTIDEQDNIISYLLGKWSTLLN
jgi:UDP-3-O-[3-hydroxymyristoyl] glucosamine N-acyltransferase